MRKEDSGFWAEAIQAFEGIGSSLCLLLYDEIRANQHKIIHKSTAKIMIKFYIILLVTSIILFYFNKRNTIIIIVLKNIF